MQSRELKQEVPFSRVSILAFCSSISECNCSRVFPVPREPEPPPIASSSDPSSFTADLYSERRLSRSVRRCSLACSTVVEVLQESSAL